MTKKVAAVVSAANLVLLLFISAPHASEKELLAFDRGYEYYLSYHPQKAVESFHAYLSEFPNSSSRDAALFWLGKSLLILQRDHEAQQIFLRLRQEMPDSPFRIFADKELNAPSTDKSIKAHIQQDNSETEKLRRDKEEAERLLSEMTTERDRLKAFLQEEKIRNKELEGKVVRFDRELKDILERLQTIRAIHEDEPTDLMLSQNPLRGDEPEICELKNEAIEIAHEREVKENIIEEIEKVPEKQVELAQKSPADDITAPDAPLYTLELIASEETWIYVVIDDKESRQRLLKPGSRIKWKAKNGFNLKIGNAGGTKIFFNGKDIGQLGEKGKVVKLRLPSVTLSTTQKQSPNLF